MSELIDEVYDKCRRRLRELKRVGGRIERSLGAFRKGLDMEGRRLTVWRLDVFLNSVREEVGEKMESEDLGKTIRGLTSSIGVLLCSLAHNKWPELAKAYAKSYERAQSAPYGNVRVCVSSDYRIEPINVSKMARERGISGEQVINEWESKGYRVLTLQEFTEWIEWLKSEVLSGRVRRPLA